MTTRSVVLSDRRTLILASLDQAANASLGQPFVTLLPAFDEAERRRAEATAGLLMDRGCVELCCVGPEAEQLHDSIDGIVEKMGALEAPRDKLPALYCVFQAKARPELVLRKRRSGWPSPLRSATASTFHAGSMPKRN